MLFSKGHVFQSLYGVQVLLSGSFLALRSSY